MRGLLAATTETSANALYSFPHNPKSNKELFFAFPSFSQTAPVPHLLSLGPRPAPDITAPVGCHPEKLRAAALITDSQLQERDRRVVAIAQLREQLEEAEAVRAVAVKVFWAKMNHHLEPLRYNSNLVWEFHEYLFHHGIVLNGLYSTEPAAGAHVLGPTPAPPAPSAHSTRLSGGKRKTPSDEDCCDASCDSVPQKRAKQEVSLAMELQELQAEMERLQAAIRECQAHKAVLIEEMKSLFEIDIAVNDKMSELVSIALKHGITEPRRLSNNWLVEGPPADPPGRTFCSDCRVKANGVVEDTASSLPCGWRQDKADVQQLLGSMVDEVVKVAGEDDTEMIPTWAQEGVGASW